MSQSPTISILLRLGPGERATFHDHPVKHSQSMESDNESTPGASHRKSVDAYRSLEVLSGDDDASLDVVFIYGLGRNWRRTWSKGDETNAWPQTFLRKDIPEVRVFAGGFDVLKDGYSFQELCKLFSDDLKQTMEKSKKPFVLIAHSLGCLIAIWAIVKEELSQSQIELIKGLIFFAPPLFRGEENEWIDFQRKIEYTGDQWGSLVSYFSEISLKFIEIRKGGRLSGTTIYGFFERMATQRFGIIVPESRIPHIFNESRGIMETHADMPKFSSRINPDYEAMVDWIQQIIDKERNTFEQDAPKDEPKTQSSDFSDGREILADVGIAILGARQALALEDHGHFRDAESAYRSAIEECGTNNSRRSILLFLQERLAALLGNCGNYAEATELGEHVFSQRVDILGFHDPDLLGSAALFCSTGRHINHCKNAFFISKQVMANFNYQKENNSHIFAYSKIVAVHAASLRDNGHLEAAILLFRDALGLSSLSKPEVSSVYVCSQKLEMALAFLMLDQSAIAKKIATDAYDKLQEILGPKHPDALHALLILAICERLQGYYSSALQKLEEINRWNTGRLAAGSSNLMLTRRELASVYALQGFYEEAIEIFEDILSPDKDDGPISTQVSFSWIEEAVDLLKPLSVSTSSDSNYEKVKLAAETHLQRMPSTRNHLDPCISAQYTGTQPLESAIKFFTDRMLDVLRSSDIEAIDLELASAGDYKTTAQRMLIAAAASNNHDVLFQLLKYKVDLNSENGYYGTALQTAACAGHFRIVQILLEHGADIDSTCGLFGTALRGALIHSHIGVVRLLVQKGANPNLRVEGTASPMQIAVLMNDVGLIRALLRNGKVDFKAKDHLFANPLQEACAIGNSDIVDKLLAHDVFIASPGGLFEGGLFDNSTQAAQYCGNSQVIRKLIQKFAVKHFGVNTSVEVTNYDNSYKETYNPLGLPSVLREKGDQARDTERQASQYSKPTTKKRMQRVLNALCCGSMYLNEERHRKVKDKSSN